MSSDKRKLLNLSHSLLCCRFDVWLRLLRKNHPAVELRSIPQALLISLCSLALSPFALLERAIYSRKIQKTRLSQDPVFILGHWRSGTTYLQNLLSRDPQFAWADPVSTVSGPNCLLLRPVLAAVQRGPLKNARPMDNLNYALDLPMEEAFGLSSISTHSIAHAIVFPNHFQDYLPTIFIEDMNSKDKAQWERSYTGFLKKLTYIHGGKQLMLKSPENTGHVRELLELYPNAKFINIYRDPYTTMMSTVNMFMKQMHSLRLSRLPDCDLKEMVEDTFLGIFSRMYHQLFELENLIPQNQLVHIKYEDFAARPEEHLRLIYETLELEGFEEALPRFREHIASQTNYKKNKFTLEPEFRDKINKALGFYFEHYGYEMEEN